MHVKNWNQMKSAAALGYFNDMKNMYNCYIRFKPNSLMREIYWYEIRDAFLPMPHELWGIGIHSSRREIYEV